jgi:NitT/TauT family transport system substrate-binding protein
MSDPSNKNPENGEGSTRIVAGQSARPKRPLGQKIGIAAVLLALVGGGTAIAATVNGGSGTPATAEETAPAGNPAAELKLG